MICVDRPAGRVRRYDIILQAATASTLLEEREQLVAICVNRIQEDSVSMQDCQVIRCLAGETDHDFLLDIIEPDDRMTFSDYL